MKTILGVLVLGVVTVFLALGIARSQEEEEVLSITKMQRQEGFPVVASQAKPEDIEVIRRYYGEARSLSQVVVASKLMDRIKEITVETGDHVSKGQTLVRFESDASAVGLAQQRLTREDAKKNLERAEALWKEGAISRQMLDQAKLAYELYNENYHTAEKTLDLTAPVSGSVALINLKEGQIAHPGDVIITIFQDDELEIVFDVVAEDRRLISEGQKITALFQDTDPVQGNVTEISMSTRDKSRLFPIYARIDANENIYPGMMATVDLLIDRKEGVLAIPVDAIMDRSGKKLVMKVVNGTARITPVTVGIQSEDFVEILSGVSRGESVAIYGHTALEDGTKLKIIDR